MQITDPVTVSTAQGASSIIGHLSNSGQTLTVLTTSSASASSAFAAVADSNAGSRGIPRALALPTFSQANFATLDIDLMSDFGSNPFSAYAVQAQASGTGVPSNHFVDSRIESYIDSMIPGLATIFDLAITRS
jgi:hypothetical protein